MKLPLVPKDKYYPLDTRMHDDYLDFVSVIIPHLLYFAEEKSLEDYEVINRKGRVGPLAGQNRWLSHPTFIIYIVQWV